MGPVNSHSHETVRFGRRVREHPRERGPDRVRGAYIESFYQRPAELKNGNDPTNFFHVRSAARSDGERLDLFLDLLSDAIVLHV
jgi:hypothetical protein